MDTEVVNEVRQWITEVHALMARSIIAMEYPNGGKDAAPAENNIAIPLGSILLRNAYWTYAEPTRSGSHAKERVDLIAANASNAFVIEMKRRVKRFDGVLRDIRRLKEFELQTAQPAANVLRVPSKFAQAKQKFGLFVATNFEEDESFAKGWVGLPRTETLKKKYKYVTEIADLLPNEAIFDCTDACIGTTAFRDTGAFRLYWILFELSASK